MSLPLLPNNAMTFTASQHGNEVLEKLMEQREKSRWCDVILHVAEQEYNAHRCVLAACSPFFDSIFKAGKTVKEQLNICSDKPEVFPNLLGYIYTGSVLIDTMNVSELLKLADKLLLFKLKDHCAEYLERYLDEENCLTVFDMAKRFKLESLFHATENLIAFNLDKIISGKEIQECHQAKLETLISNRTLNFTNEQKFLLIANWVVAKRSDRQSSFTILLTWIDWLSIDFSYICCLVQGHDLFSDENALYILMEVLNEQNLLPEELIPKFSEIKSKSSTADYNLDNENFINYAISTAIDELQEGFSHLDSVKSNYAPLPQHSTESQKGIPRPRKSITNVHEVLRANLGSDAQMDEIYQRDELVDYHYQNLCDDHCTQDDLSRIRVGQIDGDQRRPVSADNLGYTKKNYTDCHQSSLTPFSNIMTDDPKHKYYSDAHGIQNTQSNDFYTDDNWSRDQPFDLSYEGNFSSNPTYGVAQSSKSTDDCSGFNAQVAISSEELDQAFKNIVSSPNQNMVLTNHAQPYPDSMDFRTYILDESSINVQAQKEKNVKPEISSMSNDARHDFESHRKAKKTNNFERIDTHDSPNEIINVKSMELAKQESAGVDNNIALTSASEKELSEKSVSTRADKIIKNCKRKNTISLTEPSPNVSRTKEKKICDICPMEFSVTKEYYSHMKEHFPGPNYSCDTCSSTFNSIYHLMGHRVSHSTDKKFFCKLCSFKSHRECNLREHITMHTNLKPHKCNQCVATFSRAQFLFDHVKQKHSNEKLYQCPDCDWRGKTANVLRTHSKKHSGDMLKCSYEGCIYESTKKSHMKEHMQSHANSRTFICDVCNAGFSIKSHLLRHSRKHRLDTLISCSSCEYSCTRKDALQRHFSFKHKDSSKNNITALADFGEFSSSPFCLAPTEDPDGNLVIVSELEDELGV